jgi:hypothetical protein
VLLLYIHSEVIERFLRNHSPGRPDQSVDIVRTIKRLCFQIVNKKIAIPFMSRVEFAGAPGKDILFC